MKNLSILVAVVLAFTACTVTANKTISTGSNAKTAEVAEDQTDKSILDQAKKAAFNKVLVLGLMNEVFGGKNIDAIDKYVVEENYIQHSPNIPDGREAVKKYLNKNLAHLPKITLEIQRIAAEGDIVFVHWKSTQLFDAKVASIIDVFRIEKEKIAEHWSAIQFLGTESANPHPLF